MDYCTKGALYGFVTSLKSKFGISDAFYPLDIDFIKNATSSCIDLEYAQFKTRGLCGIAFVGDIKDTVILNRARTENEQLFDFLHELIHLSKHRDVESFQCFDKVQPTQNRFLEWQANEGAAEMVVPYRRFIPKFVHQVRGCGDSWADYGELKDRLALEFGVTPAIISYRIDNLRYEIRQYETGSEINHLKVKSNNQLTKEGIDIISYNQIYAEYFYRDIRECT